LHHPTRKGIGYFGAVRIRDGKFVYSREVHRFNADTFFTFLKKLRRLSCRAGRRVVVILDNVRYHHASLHRTWRDKCQKSFTLLFMPPYSPELNPIERVWKRWQPIIGTFRRSTPSLSPLSMCSTHGEQTIRF